MLKPLFNKVACPKEVCENKDYCDVVIPFEGTKILEFNQYRKSDTTLFIIYADLESLKEKIDGDKKNPEKSSTAKLSEHILSAYSIYSILFFFNFCDIII